MLALPELGAVSFLLVVRLPFDIALNVRAAFLYNKIVMTH